MIRCLMTVLLCAQAIAQRSLFDAEFEMRSLLPVGGQVEYAAVDDKSWRIVLAWRSDGSLEAVYLWFDGNVKKVALELGVEAVVGAGTQTVDDIEPIVNVRMHQTALQFAEFARLASMSLGVDMRAAGLRLIKLDSSDVLCFVISQDRQPYVSYWGLTDEGPRGRSCVMKSGRSASDSITLLKSIFFQHMRTSLEVSVWYGARGWLLRDMDDLGSPKNTVWLERPWLNWVKNQAIVRMSDVSWDGDALVIKEAFLSSRAQPLGWLSSQVELLQWHLVGLVPVGRDLPSGALPVDPLLLIVGMGS